MLVCSSCRSPLADGTTHCPRCGPGSLALFSGEHLAAMPDGRTPPSGREQALARALGRHYRVVRLLGRGGFAEVYEVRDDDLHRRLAVKVLRDDIPWSSATLARFKQEARAIARLSHPNTLPIHFVGEADGLVFYVMPYCEGRTLTEILRGEGALSVRRALAIAEPILETLQHAHEHGLVHRDVKPDNILIENATGRPLLVDFGIVKYLDGPAGNTQTGFIVGTPLYMSPEQALGRGDVDARTDVYGMGVVLFQMLTGAPPFSGADSQEIVTRHLHDAVPVATLSRDRVPPWLSAVIVRCLAKHPDDRYPDARAVLGALREGRAAAPGTDAPGDGAARSEDETPTAAMPRATRRPAGRRRGLVAVGLVAAAGALWASVHPRPEPTPPTPARPSPVGAAPALLVHNRLTEPIALTYDDTGFTIGAADSVRLPLRAGQALDARWAMVRPAASDGRMLGAALEGSIVRDEVRDEVRGEAIAVGRRTPMALAHRRERLAPPGPGCGRHRPGQHGMRLPHRARRLAPPGLLHRRPGKPRPRPRRRRRRRSVRSRSGAGGLGHRGGRHPGHRRLARPARNARHAAAPGGPAARSAQGISARPLMTLADRNAVTPPPPPAGPGVARVAVFLLVLLIAAAGAGVYLLLRPRLEFTNTLAAPVRLVVGDAAARTVAPGATIRLPIARGHTLVAQWELVRPMSANATPMGEEMRGSTVVREPSGTVPATAASRTADGAYFAPLVTNAGSQALRVTVNAGLQGAVDCGCAVRPGARRVFIGYYRLYRNSTVSAWVRGLGTATFRDLGPQVTAPDGAVGLRFEDKDLRGN